MLCSRSDTSSITLSEQRGDCEQRDTQNRSACYGFEVLVLRPYAYTYNYNVRPFCCNSGFGVHRCLAAVQHSDWNNNSNNKQTNRNRRRRKNMFTETWLEKKNSRIPVRVQMAPKSQDYLFLCSLPSATRRLIHGYSPFSISDNALVRHHLKSLPNTLFVSLSSNRYPFSQRTSTCLADHL